jgi:hypothetical protein
MSDENENSKWVLLLLVITVALVVLALRLWREVLALRRQLKEIDCWR